ncbi:hypothetical protein IVB18_36020 [Bradyrhizobium sp. 186]|uniref:hypothetical protein n=1 Tax=Bradyrhizobium sp. 186 TaxID=2782654 RepID=UPI002001BE09|nr:hypothetical protein [Bradyrhizobium sp. 186]UPK33566.1 hypothetical protein IVB18_36020 [Bradyrhizobium sp. 186]
MIKLFQLKEHAPEDGCGNIVVIDDAAPQQALRNALFNDCDLRLREALAIAAGGDEIRKYWSRTTAVHGSLLNSPSQHRKYLSVCPGTS